MGVKVKIDVIIPVYKPDKGLFDLLDRIFLQNMAVQKVILMNTEQKYFEQLTAGTHWLEKYQIRGVEVYHLSKRDFDHAETRNAGVRKSDADIFVCMTQDAVPADKHLIENLTEPLRRDERIAAAYARQIPGSDCSVLERFARRYNYPKNSAVKREEDRGKLGVKTYFLSNVCAAYRRTTFEELGGFDGRAIFNEDMLYCAKALRAGYQAAYAAQAKVYHSHNYTCKQQFRRNFDIGVSHAMHPEVFGEISSEAEGRKMVREAVRYLDKTHKRKEIPGFFLQCAAKYAGYLLGKHYRLLPRKLILVCTSNREFWRDE